MHELKKIAVYCGSNSGSHPSYSQQAFKLGQFLAGRGIDVVYGGGGVGLMNEIASGALDEGGHVIGVITKKLLALEVGRHDLTKLHVTPDMRTRKALMADLADGFIAMPGGFGTLEELFEVATMSQLRIHLKPIGLFNIDGYYDGLIEFLKHAVNEGFIRRVHEDLIVSDAEMEPLLEKMANTRIPEFSEWLEKA